MEGVSLMDSLPLLTHYENVLLLPPAESLL
jgi:hypothetical protein